MKSLKQILDDLSLSHGIVPMDLGTRCATNEEATRLIDHIGSISKTQTRNAWGAGILRLGR